MTRIGAADPPARIRTGCRCENLDDAFFFAAEAVVAGAAEARHPLAGWPGAGALVAERQPHESHVATIAAVVTALRVNIVMIRVVDDACVTIAEPVFVS